MKQKPVSASALFVLFVVLVGGLFHLSKLLNFNEPELVFFDWVWPHQEVDNEYLDEFEYCHRWVKKCHVSGPRFLVGTFKKTGQYVPHLSVQDTFNRKESIGLVWRIEALIAPYLVAKEMKSALSFFSDLKVPVEYLVVDYDSPSKGLYAYAEWIDLLHSEQIELPVSVTGLVSWLQDNPEGFEVLLGSAEAVNVQLYQGSERVALSDHLVLAIESFNNVQISLYCPDSDLLDYLLGKVSISRTLDIGIFDGSGCGNLLKQ